MVDPCVLPISLLQMHIHSLSLHHQQQQQQQQKLRQNTIMLHHRSKQIQIIFLVLYMIISIIVLRSVIEYYKLPNKVTISVFYYFICTDFMCVLMRYIYLYVCVHMYLLDIHY